MVTLLINGKKTDRTFQNMAQALAFAYQNGECYAAQKIELTIGEQPKEKAPLKETSNEAPKKPAEKSKEEGIENAAA